jgi:uncharacterized protein
VRVVRTTLLTHTDLDGIGCAVVFSGARPGQGPIELVENGAIDDRVREALAARIDDAAAHEVLVTDHGVDATTADTAEAFVRAGGRFVLLDHHRSSLHLSGRAWATVDPDRSATGLLFDHLGRPGEFAEFARLVEDHDLWRHQDPRSARLATLVGLLGAERFLTRFGEDPSVELREGERLLVDNEEARREDYLVRKVEQARVAEIGVAATAIVNPGKRTVSLRGRGVDVSAIAERFGGGGHARAAAFTFRAAALETDLTHFEERLIEELAP